MDIDRGAACAGDNIMMMTMIMMMRDGQWMRCNVSLAEIEIIISSA